MEGEDAPYYYSERPNIGVLAGAAWKVGWLALEEFGVKKRAKKQARADLWIYPIELEMGEYIEAKQAWRVNKAEDKLDQAVKAAREISKNESYLRIGILFLCPSINEKYELKINEKIKEVINATLEIECDALAWSFPVSTRKLRGTGRSKHVIYPGVILLAKVVD